MATKTLTLTKVWNPHAKIGAAKATFEKDGAATELPYNLKWWVSSAFNEKLVEGAVVAIEIEVKKDKNDADEHWVKTVDGVGEKGGAKGGFAGKSYTPKSREEIHAASLSGIIKSCIEHGQTIDTAKKWLDLYRNESANYMSQTQGRQGAS